MQELLQTARRLAREAGHILAEAWRQPFEINHKGTVDLVTTADHASEAHIKAGLRQAFPDHAILAEETGASGDGAAVRWVIDPLDGTVNFAHHNPHFCVLIGVQERRPQGHYETVCGVTFDPLRNEEFVAVRGEGATLQGQRIHVSNTSELLQSLNVTGFGYDRLLGGNDNHAEFCRLNLVTQGVRRFGSAGLDLAYVACGRFDMYWEYKLFPWDYTPGVLLVREAGGMVTNLEGAAMTEGTLLACNPALHGKTMAALASAHGIPVNSRQGIKAHLPPEVAAKLRD